MDESKPTHETDEEIEARVRLEMAMFTPIRLRVPGPYEIAALLRLLDITRADVGEEHARRSTSDSNSYNRSA